MSGAGTADQSHWVKDDFVLKCESCKVGFSLSVRRHHCRCCGQVFCKDCVTKTIGLHKLGYGAKKQKVCEQCFTKISTIQERDVSDMRAGKNAKQSKEEESNPLLGWQREIKEAQTEMSEGLRKLYTQGIKPIEVQFRFGEFYSPVMSEADFSAKPMVLLMGQYSVGKTSFIRFLCGRDFPGMRIGPEPTTDRFVVVAKSDLNQDNVLPGNALAVRADRPFRSLQSFGASFLNKLECSEVAVRGNEASILDSITLVDTPGVLSGEKQRIGRSYNFPGVVQWFAGRCDRILLLFDAHKLDISDEFQAAIQALKGNDEKIRVVLNKADSVDAQQLMKVHGALMWSLGKVVNTPEVVRVYVGSFWDKPLQNTDFEDLFRKEHADLLSDLHSLPGSSVVRRVNEVVKRARSAKTHALLIDHLRQKLPFFRKEGAMKQMMDKPGKLEEEFKMVSRKHDVPLGDFPDPNEFRKHMHELCNNDLSGFPPLNPRMISDLDDILQSLVPRLLTKHQARMQELQEQHPGEVNPFLPGAKSATTGGGFRGTSASVVVADQNTENAFAASSGEWAIKSTDLDGWSRSFEQLRLDVPGQPTSLKGVDLRKDLLSTGLKPSLLKVVWDLADVDNDGALDLPEYALAQYLIRESQTGKELPATLPMSLVPPSKR